MSKPSHANETQVAKKAPQKPQPAPEQTGGELALAELAPSPLSLANAHNLQSQATRLGDLRLHAIQRQMLANQIGQTQGNGHLQQVMAATKQNWPTYSANALQRQCACGGTTETKGECTQCRQKRLGLLAVQEPDTDDISASPLSKIQRFVIGDKSHAQLLLENTQSQAEQDNAASTENTPASANVEDPSAATNPEAHEQALQQVRRAAQTGEPEQKGEVARDQPVVEAPASQDVSAQPPAAALQAAGASQVQGLQNLASQIEPGQAAAPPTAAADTVASIPEMQALQNTVNANQAPLQDGAGSPVVAEAMTQRDTAVASAQTASTALTATQVQIGQLASSQVNFAPPAPETMDDQQPAYPGSAPVSDADPAAAEERSTAASGMVNQFVGEIANRAQEITALGQTIPAQIQPIADTTTALITTAVAEQSTAITAQVAQIRAEAEAEAQATRGQITQQHETAAAAIREATATARQRVEAEYTATLATVAQHETAQLQRIEELYAQGDRTFRAAGTTVGNEATQIGADKAQNYMAGLRDVDDSFLDGPLTYNRGKAKADAATQVARGYHDGLIEEANKQADHAQQGKSHDIETAHTTATQAREAMQAQQTAVLSSLAAAEQHSLQQAEQTKASLLQSVDQTLQATLQTLGQQEATTLQTVQEAGATQTASVQQMAQGVITGIQDNINQAAASLVESAQSIPASMQGQPAPELGVLGGMFADALGQLDSGVGAIHAQIEQGITASQQSFDQTGQQVLGALATNSQSATEQITATGSGLTTSLGNLNRGATEAFTQLQQQHTSTTTESANSAVQGYQRAADGVQSTFDRINQGLERGFNESAAGLERGLRGSLSKMEQEIGTKADEAASHVAPRWKSIVKWVLIIAVIVVVALVIGPFVIGAVGGAAAALGAGAAASAIGTIVGGAIVGALTSATMQVINNWGDNKALGEGVGRAALIGAIGGAVGGAAGLGAQAITNSGLGQFALNTVANVAVETVTNAATGNLTWESFGMSVLSAVAVGAAMHAASTGRSGFSSGEVEATGIGRFQQRMTASGEAFGTAAVGTIRGPSINTGASSGVHIDEPANARANMPEVDEPRPGGTGGRSEPELEGGSPRGQAGETDVEGGGPGGRAAENEPEALSNRQPTSGEPEIEGGTPRAPEGEAGAEGASSGRTNHIDEPEIEPGVVAKESGADGHEIKVLKDGRVVRCSDCATIKTQYSDELDLPSPTPDNPERTFRQRLDEIEAHPDPEVKAQRAAQLEQELSNIRSTQSSRLIDPNTGRPIGELPEPLIDPNTNRPIGERNRRPTEIVTESDGTVTTSNNRKDPIRTRIDPDGTTTVVNTSDGNTTVTHPDGTRIFREGNGDSITVVSPDGTTTIHRANGNRYQIDPDGTTTVTMPDGTTSVIPQREPPISDTNGIIDNNARTHILEGEGPGSGGHGPGAGRPGKSEYPPGWTDERILNVISDIATDPHAHWTQQTGSPGATHTSSGKPVRWKVESTVEGVNITVIVEPQGRGVVTGFPTNMPQNPILPGSEI